MDFNEYQHQAQRTSNTAKRRDKMENGIMGLCGEAGEAMDIYKKFKFQGHPLKKDDLIMELGDIMWYVAETATALGVTMENIAKMNILKLRERYPHGFRPQDSLNRKEDKSDENMEEGNGAATAEE